VTTDDGVLRQLVETMGTVISLEVHLGELPPEQGWVALAHARADLLRVDAVFSTWKPNSSMSRIRRGEMAVEDGPSEIAEVLGRCRAARELSSGWFDPWSMPGGVDPTGLVKGWAAARAARILEEAGARAAMVNAGGDVAVFGGPETGEPWRIGVQDPFRRDRLIAVVAVGAAIATSGCYERGQHLIDPHTGEARADAASASVVGPDLGIADALATALCVVGLPGLEFLAGSAYEALVVGHDGALSPTEGFPFAEGGGSS